MGLTISYKDKMTHSKQLGSKLMSLLLAFAMILALMPAVSFTASAADADYAMAFSSSFPEWSYTDSEGNTQVIDPSNTTGTIRADKWTWYGSGDSDAGYEKNTLVLEDGFSFSTTSEYGIYAGSGVTVVVNGDCTINACREAIHSASGLNIIGDNAASNLTVNKGIVSDAALNINGVDIESVDFTTAADTSGLTIQPLLYGENIFLNNTSITANDNWKDKNVISAAKMITISRGVTLDLPASTINANSTIIAGLDSVNNILGNGYELDARVSPYGSDSGLGALTPIDSGKRMTLSSTAFKFIGDVSDIVIEDKAVFGAGQKTLLGGQKYRLDLSGLVSLKDFNIITTEYQGYLFSVQRDVNGRAYLVIDVPNTTTNSPITPTLSFADNKFGYSSNEVISFTPTIGRAVKTDKVGFYHQGSYGSNSKPTDCYTVSATYNGNPLELQGTYPDEYFPVPSGGDIDVTLIPKDGFMFDPIAIDDGTSHLPISQSGTYTIKTDGTDITLILTISRTYGQQYYKADISDDLRQSLADGDIEAVTLTYPDGTVKTLDGTHDQFPAYVLNGTEVTVSITSSRMDVISINDTETDYDSDTGVYSVPLSVTADTTITAELDDAATLCSIHVLAINLPNTENKVAVITAPINSRNQYKIGTECEIFANVTDDKFIDSAEFNGAAIEPYKQDSSGCYYKVTTAAGVNDFLIFYADLSTLAITKPVNGSVTFSGRLDGGRSSETLADGTQVYSIGTGDEVTLTITPDNGYRLKSVKLDGNKTPVVKAENGACTFMMEHLVSWTFTAEFVEIPAGNATVTVNCGENGTVSPSTSDYPIGTVVTLTVTPDSGYEVKSAKLDGKSISLKNGKYTFTLTADCVFSVEFQKKSTGGSSGSRPSGSTSNTGTSDTAPTLNGKTISWSEIASDISKMDENSSVNIDLNGSTAVPAEVLKAIKDRKITAAIRFDDYKSWTIDGSRITSDNAYADLSLIPSTSSVNGARGIAGYRFTTGGNNVGAEMNIKFRNGFTGKFANLYFVKDGNAVFVSTARVADDGYVTLPGAESKGEYVIMLCDYSDLPGDSNNDGVMNVLDVSAILKEIVGGTKSANAQMGDFNGDGTVNALDASAILKLMVL